MRANPNEIIVSRVKFQTETFYKIDPMWAFINTKPVFFMMVLPSKTKINMLYIAKNAL